MNEKIEALKILCDLYYKTNCDINVFFQIKRLCNHMFPEIGEKDELPTKMSNL